MTQEIREITFEHRGQRYTAYRRQDKRELLNSYWEIQGIGRYNGLLEIENRDIDFEGKKDILNALGREISDRGIPLSPIYFE